MDVAIGEHGKPSKDLSTPYCDYIRALLPAYPQLQILDDFVQDADWTKWEAFGQPKPAGLTKFDVVIFDIEIHGDAERKTRLHQSGTLRSEAETESYIEAHPLTQRDSVRLFLVEDLSRAVVEYFGAKYKLDPQVFESHLKGQERLKSGRPLYEYRLAARPSPPTNSDYCTRHHFSVDYIRPYKFGDGTENSWKVVQRKRWQTANVIRNGDAYLPIKSSDAYYSRERFSVAYISNREEGPKLGALQIPGPSKSLTSGKHLTAFAGILLFDPILPLDQPRTLPGYRNFLPIPIFGSANEGSPSNDIGHFSLRNDFLDWLSHLSGADLQIYAQSFGAHNLSLLSHLFRVAAANAIDTFEEIRDTIEFVELRIHGYWRDMKVDIDEKKACDCIQILRYFITDSLECMDAILVTLKGRFRCSTGVGSFSTLS